MKINQLIANNINHLDAALLDDQSLGIAGLSGSGKTTFAKPLGKNPRSVSFPYCPSLNISIYFLILWKPTSAPSRWKKCRWSFFSANHPFQPIPVQPLAHILVCLKRFVFVLLKNSIFLQKFFPLIMP